MFKKLINPYPTLQLFWILRKRYLDITWQVKEIVWILETVINLIRKILNRVLIGYVFNHKSGPGVIPDINGTYLEDITVIIFELVDNNVLWTHQDRLWKYLRLTAIHDLCLILSKRLGEVTGVPVDCAGVTDMTVFTIRWTWSLWKSVMQKLCLSPLLLFTVFGFRLLDLTPWTAKAFFLNFRNNQIGGLYWRVRR